MIYWVTQSYGTSARYYYEAAQNPWTPVHDRMPVVEALVGVSVLPEESGRSTPSSWRCANGARRGASQRTRTSRCAIRMSLVDTTPVSAPSVRLVVNHCDAKI